MNAKTFTTVRIPKQEVFAAVSAYDVIFKPLSEQPPRLSLISKALNPVVNPAEG